MNNNTRTYDRLIKDMPVGLDRAVLRLLSFHTGRTFAIGRQELVLNMRLLGFDVHERLVRHCIRGLRRAGHLICSAPGEDGGYYMAWSLAEFEEFARHEFLAKIGDMSETLAAMRAAAKETFGDALQLRLI
jgi:hypothetical protein